MNPENAAWGLLCDFVNCVPKSRHVRRAAMKPDYQEIWLIVTEKHDERIDRLVIYKDEAQLERPSAARCRGRVLRIAFIMMFLFVVCGCCLLEKCGDLPVATEGIY